MTGATANVPAHIRFKSNAVNVLGRMNKPWTPLNVAEQT
jgi:hypothetical protein